MVQTWNEIEARDDNNSMENASMNSKNILQTDEFKLMDPTACMEFANFRLSGISAYIIREKILVLTVMR